MHRRYSNIDFILAMDLEEASGYIRFAFEKQNDEYLFQRWLPYQAEMGFDEFKEKIRIANIPEKPDEEILSDVEMILEQFARSKNEGEKRL